MRTNHMVIRERTSAVDDTATTTTDIVFSLSFVAKEEEEDRR